MVDTELLDRHLRMQAELAFGVELPIFGDLVGWREARTVLDPGCGNGAYLAKLADAFPGIHFIGLDLDGDQIGIARRHYARPNVEHRVGTVRDVDESVDIVVTRSCTRDAPGLDDVASWAADHVSTGILELADAGDRFPPVLHEFRSTLPIARAHERDGHVVAGSSERDDRWRQVGFDKGWERVVSITSAPPFSRSSMRRWLEAIGAIGNGGALPERFERVLEEWFAGGDEVRMDRRATWYERSPIAAPTSGSTIRYRILDERSGSPEVVVESPVPIGRLRDLDRDGYLVLPRFVDPADAEDLASVVADIAEVELAERGAGVIAGNGYYVKQLVWKHEAFDRFLLDTPALPLARAMLGPQVRLGLDCRVAFEGVADAGVPWHIHYPGMTDPVPPWFSPPHSLHVLVYLDRVGEDEGALCVVPGSHRDPLMRSSDIADEDRVELFPDRGDAVAIHGNLWHRTLPSTERAQRRRVLFIGYTAAWVEGEAYTSYQPSGTGASVEGLAERAEDSPEIAELLGRFLW